MAVKAASAEVSSDCSKISRDQQRIDKIMRKQITILKKPAPGKELVDFPFFLQIRARGLKKMANAGKLYFTARDGKTILAHEISQFDRSRGALRAWVRLPRLSSSGSAAIYLHADAAARPAKKPGRVWDDDYHLVIHDLAAPEDSTGNHKKIARFSKARSAAVIGKPAGIKLGKALTVEAWVDCPAPRAEAMQVLAAQWKLRAKLTLKAFRGYDAGRTDGLDTSGFFGAVFDGRYVYFSPQHDIQDRHGKVLRYDTHGAFRDKKSWAGYEAGNTGGLVTKGYYGAIYDGRYVYFIPRRAPDCYHTRVLRYDTRGGFKDRKSWQAHDAGQPHSCQSAAFDGRYIYFCPGSFSRPKNTADKKATDGTPQVTGMNTQMVAVASGVIIRYDTRGGFADKRSWITYDAAGTSGLDTRDFDGAIFDGRYVYFMPLSFAAVLRYDTRSGFREKKSWRAYSIARFGFTRTVGGVFDGRYVYIVPYGDCPVAVRCDTAGDFSAAKSWSAYEIARTPGLKVIGFDGGAFDGRYVYYIPYYKDKTLHGCLLRYDTTRDFLKPSSWSWIDAGTTDGLPTRGFNAGASDGRYLYCAPWNHPKRWPPDVGGNGAVLRYDFLEKGSFCFRFMDFGHNGGLNGAVPGPRFIVNTERGPVSIAANKIPPPGKHHFAGVYDGARISLYIDGQLVNEQHARGKISAGGAALTIGCLEKNTAALNGSISELRISSCARGAAWLKAQFRNQSTPARCCKIS